MTARNGAGQYQRGRAFEYQIQRRLQRNGYVTVRSAGSRTLIDILALAPRVVLAVQCKRSGVLAPADWNAFVDVCEAAGAWPLMVERAGRVNVAYWLLEDRKDGSRRRQPMRECDPRDFLSGGVHTLGAAA